MSWKSFFPLCYSTLHCFDESERKIASFHYTLSLTFSFFLSLPGLDPSHCEGSLWIERTAVGTFSMDCMGGSETYLLSRLLSHQSNLTWRLWKRALLHLSFACFLGGVTNDQAHEYSCCWRFERDRLDSCALKRVQIGLRLALATHVVALDCSSKAMSWLDCQYT